MGNGLTNEAVIDLVKAAGLDWHAGFNLDDDENRYGTLVRLAFDLGVAQMAPAALSAPNWGNRRTDSLAGWINELATLGDHPKGMDGWLRHAIKTIASGLSRYATCEPVVGSVAIQLKTWRKGVDQGPVPVLYSDQINDDMVRRDDLWLATTGQLAKPVSATAAPKDTA